MNIEIKKSIKPVKYSVAIKLLEERLLDININKKGDLIWLLEHEEIYTAGTSYKESEVLNKNINLIKTNRGGKITYHGPGQLICYFVIDLKQRQKDIRKFITIIEKTIIETLSEFNIKSFGDPKNIGIWVTDKNEIKKVAAIGVRVSKWIAYHGFAININTDLAKYQNIIPCGISDKGVTSLKNIKNQNIHLSNLEKKIDKSGYKKYAKEKNLRSISMLEQGFSLILWANTSDDWEIFVKNKIGRVTLDNEVKKLSDEKRSRLKNGKNVDDVNLKITVYICSRYEWAELCYSEEIKKIIEDKKKAADKKKVADAKKAADKKKAAANKKISDCIAIENKKIGADIKGYKDVFFGMTKDEFRTLARCNKGSLFDIQNQGYVQDDSRNMGNNLIIFELNNDRYRYNVNAIFSGPGVTEISVRAYSEYHNIMRINSKSSGITGIDKIKDLLEKKYSLLIKPSDESIEKYNEYIGWNEVDFVFQNKDTQNLVILRVGYRDPDVLGLKYSYQGNIHYLSERASKTYLNNIQSEVLSEDDF